MSRFRVYLKTWNLTGTAWDVETEITDDVDINSISSISESSDSSEYDVGVFKYSNFTLKVNNVDGVYSDVGSIRSIFVYTRRNSRVRITWDFGDDITQCGNALCGDEFAVIEKDIFYGILNDESTQLNVQDNFINFQVRGLDSFADDKIVPVGFAPTSTKASDIITALAAEITAQGGPVTTQITINHDTTLDNYSSLVGKTLKEAFDELLLITKSVLFPYGDELYILPIDLGDPSVKTFYGQGSENGIEDVQSITGVKNGLNKTFNNWNWEGTALNANDSASIAKYGTRTKELSLDTATTTTPRDEILDRLNAEYKLPRQELSITVPMSYENLLIKITDIIRIDYPIVYRPTLGTNIPIYGVAIYGEDAYPEGDFSFSILDTSDQVVLARKLNIKNQTITFKVRKV
jgi:hypothetical protein